MPDCPGRHVLLNTDVAERPVLLDGAVVVLFLDAPLQPGETCAPLIESAHAGSYVVTHPARTESPIGLSWPGITPPIQVRRTLTAWSTVRCTCTSTDVHRHYRHCAKWRAVLDKP